MKKRTINTIDAIDGYCIRNEKADSEFLTRHGIRRLTAALFSCFRFPSRASTGTPLKPGRPYPRGISIGRYAPEGLRDCIPR